MEGGARGGRGRVEGGDWLMILDVMMLPDVMMLLYKTMLLYKLISLFKLVLLDKLILLYRLILLYKHILLYKLIRLECPKLPCTLMKPVCLNKSRHSNYRVNQLLPFEACLTRGRFRVAGWGTAGRPATSTGGGQAEATFKGFLGGSTYNVAE